MTFDVDIFGMLVHTDIV